MKNTYSLRSGSRHQLTVFAIALLLAILPILGTHSPAQAAFNSVEIIVAIVT